MKKNLEDRIGLMTLKVAQDIEWGRSNQIKRGEYGPQRIIRDARTRFHIEDAQEISDRLRRLGFSVQPYALPGTFNVWHSSDKTGIPYSLLATKELIKTIASELGVDYKTFKGFRKVLKYLKKKTFYEKQIDEWGTTLIGMISKAYEDSPSTPVLELIAIDEEFARVRDLKAYDFPYAPMHTWRDHSQNPAQNSRDAVKQLIVTISRELNVDYKTFEGFKKIMPHLTYETFRKKRINRWGTTIGAVLQAYHSSSEAVLDLIDKDDEFKDLRDLKSYNFHHVAGNTWTDENGEPTQASREVIKCVLRKSGELLGVDYITSDGMKLILTNLMPRELYNDPIDRWGTTAKGAMKAYSKDMMYALSDLINYDPDFASLDNLLDNEFLFSIQIRLKSRPDISLIKNMAYARTWYYCHAVLN